MMYKKKEGKEVEWSHGREKRGYSLFEMARKRKVLTFKLRKDTFLKETLKC